MREELLKEIPEDLYCAYGSNTRQYAGGHYTLNIRLNGTLA